MNFTILNNNSGKITTTEKKCGDILYITVNAALPCDEVPEKFTIRWYFSAKDCAFTWNPTMMDIHGLYFDWGKKVIKSRLASNMPLQQLISRDGRNKLNISVSDVDTPIEIGT